MANDSPMKRFTWLVLLSAAIVATAGSALATQPEGFKSTVLAKGQFTAFDVTSLHYS
jgi:hypothetical protein